MVVIYNQFIINSTLFSFQLKYIVHVKLLIFLMIFFHMNHFLIKVDTFLIKNSKNRKFICIISNINKNI
jgi:hypothetical protein